MIVLNDDTISLLTGNRTKIPVIQNFCLPPSTHSDQFVVENSLWFQLKESNWKLNVLIIILSPEYTPFQFSFAYMK